MNKIKAVIFDMDGVLIDAKDWHYESLNRALNYFGIAINRYEHIVTYDGLPTREKLKMLSLDKGLPTGLHEFINRLKQKFTEETIIAKCKPTFNHEYALSRLSNEGYQLAVCSNSVRKTVELMMNRSNLSKYLAFFLSNEDVSKPKPDPEMYSKAVDRLGCRPDECLVVEDNENGVKAALAARTHLMRVDSTIDVTYHNIIKKISQLDAI